MSSQDKRIDVLKQKLLENYSKKKLSIIADIIDKKDPCSLRILEWFVGYYAKEKKVIYNVNGKPFNVYSSYKNEQMSSFNKSMFDMYRRMPKFPVKISKDRVFETTVAQLNFFNWVFKYKILDYVTANFDSIKKDLDKNKPSKQKKKFFEDIKISRIKMTIYFD
jgi:hypothetical protein